MTATTDRDTDTRPPRRLLPIPEACAVLGGIGRSYLYELVASGRLTKVNLGRRSFITAASVDTLVAELAGTADTSAAAEQITLDRAALEAAVKHGDPYNSAEILGRILRDAIITSAKVARR
jgi:excisionase family DNA binding protein